MSVHTAERPPVLIAAFHEAEYIGQSLNFLDRSSVSPIVIVNGEDDGTAGIASEFGAHVIMREEQGKLPALQDGVRYLRDAGYPLDQPILFTDADSHPGFPKKWANALTEDMRHNDGPTISSGLIGVAGWNLPVNALRTIRCYQGTHAAAKQEKSVDSVWGANIAITFGNEETREQFLAMPHIWPREDSAIARMIIDNSGNVYHVLKAQSIVLTSAREWLPITKRLRLGRERSMQLAEARWQDRAAPTVEYRFDGENNIPIQ